MLETHWRTEPAVVVALHRCCRKEPFTSIGSHPKVGYRVSFRVRFFVRCFLFSIRCLLFNNLDARDQINLLVPPHISFFSPKCNSYSNPKTKCCQCAARILAHKNNLAKKPAAVSATANNARIPLTSHAADVPSIRYGYRAAQTNHACNKYTTTITPFGYNELK